MLDALVIGHGLAGAVLAHTLARAGWKILVIDQPAPDSASRVAAGLVNPLAGRRFALTWRAEELLPAAAAFYKSIEMELGTGPLWTDWPIHKFFATEAEATAGLPKADGSNAFISGALAPLDTPALRALLGGLRLVGGGALRVEELLDALAAHRAARGEYVAETFDYVRLETAAPTADYVLADGTTVAARYVIFCEGVGVRGNPWFNWLPVTPNTGEVLDVRLPLPAAGGPAPDAVLNGGVYVVPQAGAEATGHWRVGATYDWRTTPPAPTDAARAELLQKLARHVKAPADVLTHRAAQRPAVRDRRPLLGAHPTQSNVLLFNGFGSKGVGLAPGLAAHWLRVLTGAETALWPDVNLARFGAFYPGGAALPAAASPPFS